MNRHTDGVDAIFFDAVGTLIFPDPPVSKIYAEVAQQFGAAPPDPNQLRQHFYRCFAEEEQRDRAVNWQTSEEWEIGRWRRIVTSCLHDVNDPEAAFQALFAHFARPDAWQLHPEAERVLPELRQRGFIVGMGSNYDARLQRVLAGHTITRQLHHVIISSLIGWRKPGTEFFKILAETAGIEPTRILFIGDDVQNDYEGARSVGMRARLLDPAGQHPEIADRIARLDELLAG